MSEARARQFLAMAAALGGDEVIIGMARIMDGLCPDCGKAAHDPKQISLSFLRGVWLRSRGHRV